MYVVTFCFPSVWSLSQCRVFKNQKTRNEAKIFWYCPFKRKLNLLTLYRCNIRIIPTLLYISSPILRRGCATKYIQQFCPFADSLLQLFSSIYKLNNRTWYGSQLAATPKFSMYCKSFKSFHFQKFWANFQNSNR